MAREYTGTSVTGGASIVCSCRGEEEEEDIAARGSQRRWWLRAPILCPDVAEEGCEKDREPESPSPSIVMGKTKRTAI